jgi:hypothetical protein
MKQEMRTLSVLVKTGLSEFGYQFVFIEGKNIEPIGRTSTFEEQVSPEIRNLINNNALIMMIYVEDDFRAEILGIKIGKKPLFGHKHPLFLIYFDDVKSCYAIYINSSANFLEIAYPLAYILENLENIVIVDIYGDQKNLEKAMIVDLFDYNWEDYRQPANKAKSKGLIKVHLFTSNLNYYQLPDYKVFISSLKFAFNRICRVSDDFMTKEYSFIFKNEHLKSLYLDDLDKENWDEILKQISK